MTFGGLSDGPAAKPPRQPAFNVPGSVLTLIALFALLQWLRMHWLSADEDTQLLLMAAFIPARYDEGLLASGLFGFTSPITYNFLHGDWAHLGINSIWLLAMGSAVARRVGTARFLLFSAVCGVFAALAHYVMHVGELSPVIGASGAISGHMAAAIRFVFSAHGSIGGHDRDVRAIHLQPLREALVDGRVLAVLAMWLASNVLTGTGLLPVTDEDVSIAWEAHMGGFVAGLLLFGLFDRAAGTPLQAAG